MMKINSVSIFATICLVSSWSTVTCFEYKDESDYPMQCTTDDDCDFDERCGNEFCEPACDKHSMSHHQHVVCKVIKPHTPKWTCSEGYVGYPDRSKCEPKCYDNDCEDWELCYLNKCRDACDFALPEKVVNGAECRGKNHSIHWFCPEGLTGDPFFECYKSCRNDENCAREEFCVDGKCRDVCNPKYNGVDVRAKCYSLGDHGAIWRCPLRYPGNPYVACGKNCYVDDDCQANTRCVNNECRFSCDPELYQVAKDAECTEIGAHGYEWKCPKGFEGNPYTDCGDICDDEYCPDDERCVGKVCQYVCDPGLVEGELVEGSTCYAKNHTAHWLCPKNFHGDPFGSCDDSCNDDDDCLDSEKCLNNKCVSACSRHFFEGIQKFGMCSAQNHTGRLFDCATDKSADAVEYCQRRYSNCMDDNDCILTAICENGYCLQACFDVECNQDEYCETKMHEPRCEPLTSRED